MMGVREHFIDLVVRDIDQEVVLGDESVIRGVGVGIVSLQRKSQTPLKVTEVMHVLGLKKNLISISAIEDRGYVVVFRDG